ncbi:MAG: hypothetical protein D6696_16030 [Acidobacteria bacterium]|nr:MAG: hypothetical protein D6696_16030 [Acidobacteriota bacterium]
MNLRRLAAGLGLAAILAPPLAAAPPQVHALTGARIVVAPGRVVESGTVVIRDGIVSAAGDAVEPPADARLHDLAGLTIYPGLIDAYVTVPWPEDEDGEGDDLPVAGGDARGLVVPQRDASRHAVDPERFRRLRAAGFTTAMIAPQQGLLRGTSALVNLGDGGASRNVLARGVAQNLTLRASDGGGYPASLMGAEALLRQTLYDARWYARARAAYERRPAQERPPFSPVLEALDGVASGRMRVVIETQDVLDTLRWVHLIDEFGLDAVLVGNGEEYKRLAAVAASGLPHVLPLAFPEPPGVSSSSDDLSVGLEELRHWQRAPANPGLVASRLPVAFTSHGLSDPKQIHSNLARAIARGLDPDAALAGLTTVPAELLGLAGRAGTVTPGAMANLLVVDGELFVDSPKLRQVWIDGRRYELKESKPPEVDPAGTWSVTVRTGDGQQMSFTLKLEGTADSLRGSIATPGGELPLSSVTVSGKTVEMELDSTPLGMPGTIQLSMTVTGDGGRGSGTAPPGPFTFTARRTSKPNPETTP